MTKHPSRALAVAGTLLGLFPAWALAQQGTTVAGRVTSDAQTPLPGVSVGIAALSSGGVTDAEGRYTFTIPASRAAAGRTVTITARRIGFEPQSIAIQLSGGSMTQDFVLKAAATQLDQVVVTALGQAKQKSQLGTAVQQINTDELNQTFAANVENQLEGKVAGVNIVGNGTQGGSMTISIRGYTSITGTNQPLFVVDGIPISNADRGSSAQSGGMLGSKDFGNSVQDINPDDIATLTVLKGPNAAALYGSRAANGVILITTKHGRAGVQNMEVSTSYTWDTPSILPTFQNSYGQGSAGQFQWINGSGPLDGNDQSYGRASTASRSISSPAKRCRGSRTQTMCRRSSTRDTPKTRPSPCPAAPTRPMRASRSPARTSTA
jgi:TonB-dependent SusC/RagA subfamily outer membrane receptor